MKGSGPDERSVPPRDGAAARPQGSPEGGAARRGDREGGGEARGRPRRKEGAPPREEGARREPSSEAIRFWYRRHADRVYQYARWRTGSREVAEEVVSDVFVEAWRSRGSYDPEAGSVESWLLGIARNVTARHRRRRAREADRREERELDDLAASRPGPDEELLRRRRAERLLEAVWELPREDRDLVALAYGADLPRRRIAQLLDLSPEAVRTRLHRVLRRLRDRLGAEP